jgi:hypothetical protein
MLCESQPLFWEKYLLHLGFKNKWSKKATWSMQQLEYCCLLQASFLLGFLFDPEDEETCSCETLVGFHQTTWHYVQEDKTLHSHSCEKLKSTNIYLDFLLQIISWTTSNGLAIGVQVILYIWSVVDLLYFYVNAHNLMLIIMVLCSHSLLKQKYGDYISSNCFVFLVFSSTSISMVEMIV